MYLLEYIQYMYLRASVVHTQKLNQFCLSKAMKAFPQLSKKAGKSETNKLDFSNTKCIPSFTLWNLESRKCIEKKQYVFLSKEKWFCSNESNSKYTTFIFVRENCVVLVSYTTDATQTLFQRIPKQMCIPVYPKYSFQGSKERSGCCLGGGRVDRIQNLCWQRQQKQEVLEFHEMTRIHCVQNEYTLLYVSKIHFLARKMTRIS